MEETTISVRLVPDEGEETGTLEVKGDIGILTAVALLIVAAFADEVRGLEGLEEDEEVAATGVDHEAA